MTSVVLETDIYFQNYIKHIYPIRVQMLSFYMLKHVVPIVTTVQCFKGLKPSQKSATISMLHCYVWYLGSVPQLQTFGDNLHEWSLWNKAKTCDHWKCDLVLQFRVALNVCDNDLALSNICTTGKFMTLIYHCPLLGSKTSVTEIYHFPLLGTKT